MWIVVEIQEYGKNVSKNEQQVKQKKVEKRRTANKMTKNVTYYINILKEVSVGERKNNR